MVVLGIDLGGTSIKLGAIDDGVLLAAATLPTTSTPADLDAVEAVVASWPVERPRAVGIAVPGIVDRARGRLLAAHGKHGSLHDRDLLGWARETWGAPAILENDGRAALEGERATGAAVGVRDVVMITLGTGIGTAAAMDGVVLRGRSDHASVLGGHCTIDLRGPRCNCGNLGCAETYGGSWALADRIRDRIGPDDPWHDRLRTGGTDFREIVALRAAGDAVAAAVLDDALLAWGIVASTMTHAYDPERIVLAGGVLAAADLVGPAIARHLHANLWSSSTRPDVVVSPDPDQAVLSGLVAIATRELLEAA